LEVWVWENLTPVCDFYLKSEQVSYKSSLSVGEKHHAFGYTPPL